MRIKSTAGDRLIKAEANDTAHQVEIHTHQVDSNGISHMLEIAALELPAGKEIVLKPLDHHIMLMKMKRELQVGQQVNLKEKKEINKKKQRLEGRSKKLA